VATLAAIGITVTHRIYDQPTGRLVGRTVDSYLLTVNDNSIYEYEMRHYAMARMSLLKRYVRPIFGRILLISSRRE
jgi:hypothetical protein